MSASSEKIARIYQAGDETQIVSLLKLVFNGWPKKDITCSPEDHWRWLYVDSPEKINSTVVVESMGNIVGALHSIFLRIKIGDEVVLGRKGTDAAVHPDARGSGLFSRMMEIRNKIESDSGALIGMGQSRNPIVIDKHAQISSYQKYPHRICIFVRIKDIDLHLKNTQDRTDHLVKPLIAPGYNALNLANRVMNVLKPKSVDGGGFTVKRVERFDEGITAFWAIHTRKYTKNTASSTAESSHGSHTATWA